MSLRWRLTALYLAAAAVALAAALVSAGLAYRRGAIHLADRTLMRACDETADAFETEKPPEVETVRSRLAAFSDSHEGFIVKLRDKDGRPLYQSDPDVDVWAGHAEPPSKDGRISLSNVSSVRGDHFRLATILLSSSKGNLVLELAVPLPSVASLDLDRQGSAIFAFLICLLGGLGWAGWLIAGRALAPVQRIAAAAEDIIRGAKSRRVPDDGRRDELGRLVDILNRMLERLERSSVQLRQFTANVSHQLKTPLTILRGEIEVSLAETDPGKLRAVLESNLSELEKLSALVGDILSFARMENEDFGEPCHQPLAPLVKQAAAKAGLLAKTKDQRIDLEVEEVTAVVQPLRFEQAFLNVIDNAVRNTPVGGRIAIRLRHHGSDATLTVEDSGPGVAPNEIPHLFERGYSKTGTGIGLGLAQALVQSFGAKLDISCPPGGGLRVSLVLAVEKS